MIPNTIDPLRQLENLVDENQAELAQLARLFTPYDLRTWLENTHAPQGVDAWDIDNALAWLFDQEPSEIESACV